MKSSEPKRNGCGWHAWYLRLLAPLFMSLASGFIVHSEYDLPTLERQYRPGTRAVSVIPLGPYDNFRTSGKEEVSREAPAECCNLLFFGVIRPFKGLEDLIQAFDSIPEEEINSYWLTVVGETWEGWTLPGKLIAQSRYHQRITFVNTYVPDDQVTSYFAGADAVVLPYHRSSASGPLHTAMSFGLPVVVTNVGGLPEAVAGYEGTTLIPPSDPIALRRALGEVARKRWQRFNDPHSWNYTVSRFEGLFSKLPCRRGRVEESSL